MNLSDFKIKVDVILQESKHFRVFDSISCHEASEKLKEINVLYDDVRNSSVTLGDEFAVRNVLNSLDSSSNFYKKQIRIFSNINNELVSRQQDLEQRRAENTKRMEEFESKKKMDLEETRRQDSLPRSKVEEKPRMGNPAFQKGKPNPYVTKNNE